MEHHRGNSRRTKELGNGAIMSPFAGKDETPWLNPELGGHDWEQRRVSTKMSRVDGLQLGAFAHEKPKGWSSLFVCLFGFGSVFVREELLLLRCKRAAARRSRSRASRVEWLMCVRWMQSMMARKEPNSPSFDRREEHPNIQDREATGHTSC